MSTGPNIYPYNATIVPTPTVPVMPAVTDDDVGKVLVVTESGTLEYQATTPIVAQAALAATTSTKGVVAETNEPFTVDTVGAADYALGLEYTLYTGGTLLSATGKVARIMFPDHEVHVSSYEIHTWVSTTNDGSNMWSIAAGGGVDTHTTEEDDPDAWVEYENTALGILSDVRRFEIVANKQGEPGNLEIYVALRVRDVKATQA